MLVLEKIGSKNRIKIDDIINVKYKIKNCLKNIFINGYFLY